MKIDKIENLKPKLRGSIHGIGFFLALCAGIILLYNTSSHFFLYKTIYIVCLLSLLLISTIYHRFNWKERVRKVLQRLDHAGILLLIGGTATPLMAYITEGQTREIILIVYWLVMFLAITKVILIPRKSKWTSVAFYLSVAVAPLLSFFFAKYSLPWSIIILFLIGGVCYLIGSVIYATKKPNLVKGIFGYHELFHFLVLVACGVHFSAISLL